MSSHYPGRFGDRASDAIDRRTAPLAALLCRWTLGALFIAHLYWKFAVLPGGLDRWWSNFDQNGYPWFVPWYSLCAELAGALLLIPGIQVRWVCLLALPAMLGAAQFWLVRTGFYFTSAGCEMPLAWAMLLVLQVLLGDGPWALSRSWLPLRWRVRHP